MPINKWVYSFKEGYDIGYKFTLIRGGVELLLSKAEIEAAKTRIQNYKQNQLPLEGQSIGTPYLIDSGVVRITERPDQNNPITIELFHESKRGITKLADLLGLPEID